MSLNHLLARDGCISCNENPTCNCAAGEQCILTSRTCSQCPQIECLPVPSSSGGINPGVIAGPVVAVLVIVSLALFWWLRRKKRRDLRRLEQLAERARKAESTFQLSHPNSPAPHIASSINRSTSSRSPAPSTGSRLPAPPPSASRRASPLPPASVNAEFQDEHGAQVRVYGPNGTINLDPRHPDNGGDPFSDRQSVSTAATSTHSTNIIPIQYIPSSRSEDAMSTAQAARTLDEARQNLFRPGAPARPARSGDSSWKDPRSPGGLSTVPRIRDSYVSDNSAAPSFLSGASYDVHNDAPKIVTSRQVHVGRVQQAEVVHMGRGNQRTLSPSRGLEDELDEKEEWDRTPTPATFGGRPPPTPTSPGYGTQEGLRSDNASGRDVLSSPGGGSNDLRFSMDSLAYRDSMSSMGTFRYLAQPDPQAIDQMPMTATPRLIGPGALRNVTAAAAAAAAAAAGGSTMRPNPPFAAANAGAGRDSTFSNRSYADSVLSGFPMIPPTQAGSSSGSFMASASGVPQSSSSNTLDGNATVPRPPPGSFKPPLGVEGQTPNAPSGRPLTAASVADSFLGTFPFVPPNIDDLAELPSAALPTAAVAPEMARR
ncbi:hypothetical protein BD324DRAFT_426692 [Kockovaella imperatae]|uniref:Membrane anchor Opy2 N-terminal domain-containing protein n=1 Tax=Kockovaella imperatae TaxID=4999 RepID=A0A1Y1UGD0_9TREE|nr:hypothetical protein BD324DRAFT_426692 [Kockovaella imperatae]ORX37120.1 hypothetical protein BD324DRAFT_426692 [Kockovaella imperatae]